MFDWLFRKQHPEKRSITLDNFPQYAKLGGYSDSSVIVTEETSLKLVAVRSCIDLIAQTIATLSLHAYERDGEDRTKAKSHPISRLIKTPNSMMTNIDWLESLMNRVLLYGNSFDYLDYQQGRPTAIYPLDDNKVKVIRHNGELIYRVTIGSETRDVQPWQMLHCKGFSKNGIQGISPIEHAAKTIASGLSMDKMADKFFSNGQFLGGILKHPERLDDQARANLRSQIEQQHQGVDKSFRMMILQEGMDYEPLGIPQDQAQFVEQRKLNILDILRIFHVPSHMMAVTEGSMSFASVEHMGISFYRNTIRPWLKKLEAEFNNKLWLEAEKDQFYLEFDPASILRGDQKSEDESFRTGTQWGWYSLNEIRRKKNLSPIEGGDLHYRPMNYEAVEHADQTEETSPIGETEQKNIDLTDVIEDAWRRILTKESKAVQRAIKKHEPQEFIAWANQFYRDHIDTVRATISPVMRSIQRSDAIDTLANEHCIDQLRDLALAAWTDDPQIAVDHLIDDWQKMPRRKIDRTYNTTA